MELLCMFSWHLLTIFLDFQWLLRSKVNLKKLWTFLWNTCTKIFVKISWLVRDLEAFKVMNSYLTLSLLQWTARKFRRIMNRRENGAVIHPCGLIKIWTLSLRQWTARKFRSVKNRKENGAVIHSCGLIKICTLSLL